MEESNQGPQGVAPAGTTPAVVPKPASTRGFASMDPARQRQIASQGGKAAHEKGTAHQFTPEEARQAGSKGGKAAHERGTAHQFDSNEAREAGRKGGQAGGNSASAATPAVVVPAGDNKDSTG